QDGGATQVFRPDAQTQLMGAAGAGYGGQPGGQTRVMGAAPAAVPPQSSWSQVQTGQQPVVPSGPADDDEPRGRGLLWGLIAVAVLAALGIILVLALGGGDETPTQVEVPEVVGMTADQAKAELEGLDLVYEPLEVASQDVADGLVVSTDPPAGTMVDPRSAVRVSISGGPDAVAIPNLENFTQEQARAELSELGITNVTTENVDHPRIAEGRVVGTNPPAGESVSPETPVVLQLSSGQVELPDLTGLDEAAARQALVDLGLSAVITTEESDQAPGTVVRQSRTPGPVPQGSEVGLVIATEQQPDEVSVPELFNLTVDTAEERLNAANLNLGTLTEEPSDEVQAGRVIRSDPSAGSPVAEGSGVNLIVSSGPADNGGGEGGGEGDGTGD
ncbi:serine/threonine protein kinase, partial [Actinotalea ferrariae CF5-4]